MKGKISILILFLLIAATPFSNSFAGMAKLSTTSIKSVSSGIFPRIFSNNNRIARVFDGQIKTKLKPAMLAFAYAPLLLSNAQIGKATGLFSLEMRTKDIAAYARKLGIDFSPEYLTGSFTADEALGLAVKEMDELLKQIIEMHENDDFNPVDIYLLALARWITVYSTYLSRQGLATDKTTATNNIVFLSGTVEILSMLTSRSKEYETLTKRQILEFSRKVSASLHVAGSQTQTETTSEVIAEEISPDEAILVLGQSDLYASFKDALDAFLLNFTYQFLSLREPQRENVKAVADNLLMKLSQIYRKFGLLTEEQIKEQFDLLRIIQAEDELTVGSQTFMTFFALPSKMIESTFEGAQGKGKF